MSKQRNIVVKKQKCDKENPYATINLLALDYVVNDNLSAGGLKLWLFLVKNQDGFSMSMWQGNLDKFGLPKSTYKRAWKELEEKGYIENIYGESYIFKEIPDGVNVNLCIDTRGQSDPTSGVNLNPTWGQLEPTDGVKVSPLNITNNTTYNNTNNITSNNTDSSVELLNNYITDNNISITNSKQDNSINTKKYNSMVAIVTGKNTEAVDRIIKQHIKRNGNIINSSIIIGAVTAVEKQYNKTLQTIEEENRAIEFNKRVTEKKQEQQMLELNFNNGDTSIRFNPDTMEYEYI